MGNHEKTWDTVFSWFDPYHPSHASLLKNPSKIKDIRLG
jgi:hypothetical protein